MVTVLPGSMCQEVLKPSSLGATRLSVRVARMLEGRRLEWEQFPALSLGLAAAIPWARYLIIVSLELLISKRE